MEIVLGLIVFGGLLLAITRLRASAPQWLMGLAGLYLLALLAGLMAAPLAIASGLGLLVLLALNHAPSRQRFLSRPALARIRAVLPPISETERAAIESGTVGWEAELFAGNPRWQRLLDLPAGRLSSAEQAFIEGPVEQLCEMLDDWHITHERQDLPPEVWQFLKAQGFFGLIVPKAFGGHEFSAFAHAQILVKICSRSITAGVTVMVPNSLGPAELILHYGTAAQKDHYLPRLARGEEIPCFALTGPSAGSDAGSIPDLGVVCKGQHEGQEVLGFRVVWDKRYITLAPVATLLGLAFRVRDPEHLLGEVDEIGITCALIPTTTPGVVIGERHNPLDIPFQNGPNQGHDVFVPLDWVIGGRAGVGCGWRMLVESLGAGRGISLPALGVSSGKLVARTTGAYARVRRQFKQPIGFFEGVEEPLARIAGQTYMMDAASRLTTAALDQGEKPAVISAMVKYHNTEAMRRVINDGMDVHGGRGICIGPRNYIARGYQGTPIAITVEGANILTRSMIVFGQGAIRCHPFLMQEMEAARDDDLPRFDRALFGHLGFTLVNAARCLVYGFSRSRLAPTPVSGPTGKYYRQLGRMSAAYALLADLTLLFLGGDLKRKEKLSGRFADGLTSMFICSAVLKQYEDAGRPQADLPLVHWSARYSLYQVQCALDEILRNFPKVWVGQLLRAVVFPLGRRFRHPNDRLGHQVARLLLQPSAARDRLTAGIYIGSGPGDAVGRLEDALHKVLAAEPIEHRLRKAGIALPAAGELPAAIERLRDEGALSADEAEVLLTAQAAMADAVAVDSFRPQQFHAQRLGEQAA